MRQKGTANFCLKMEMNKILPIYYISEKLQIKYYIRYQDDFLVFYLSKEYLKYCLE